MHFVQSVSVELFHKYPKGMMGFSPFTSTTRKWVSKDLWRSHHEILSEIRNLESNAQCWMCVIFCDLVEEILFKEVHTDAVHTHTKTTISALQLPCALDVFLRLSSLQCQHHRGLSYKERPPCLLASLHSSKFCILSPHYKHPKQCPLISPIDSVTRR